MGIAVSVLAGDLSSCLAFFVLLADSSLGLLATWGETLLPSLVGAIVGLVVFSLLYATKIVAGRKQVEELERALRDREKAVQALAESEERQTPDNAADRQPA